MLVEKTSLTNVLRPGMAICFLLRQEKLTGGPGSPGLPGDPSFPCQTQTKGILKHVCENGNVYQAQSHANAIP